MLAIALSPSSEAPPVVELDPLSLMLHASGFVALILWSLILAAVGVWVLVVIKHRQLRRWTLAERRFEAAMVGPVGLEALTELCTEHADAPGAPVMAALCRHHRERDVLAAVADSALVEQQERLGSLMPTLASIGSAAPFVGLLGTVYGIMDAFLRIGREKSATLPVVAPAIGEALIATAVGLFAAIPAVVAYNALSRRLDDLLSRLQAKSRQWVIVVGRDRGTREGGQ